MSNNTLQLLVCAGDGIGEEITAASMSVLDQLASRFNLNLHYQHQTVGLKALERGGNSFPADLVDNAKACDGVILGPVDHLAYPPLEEGGGNPSGGLRIGLDLYANIRPARTRSGLPSATGKDMDLVVVRENTEGFYADRNMRLGNGEFMPTPDLALAVRKISRASCARIAKSAFELAMTRRKKVTAVHKGNVMKISDGLFLEETRRLAAEHPEIEYEEIIVDAMAAHLVRHPGNYDVIVTTNMYGDILTDEAAELSGSLGLAGSLNAGEHHAMAQAQHGSAPDIAGQGIANPTSLILSIGMLLHWLGTRHQRADLLQAAKALDTAVDQCLMQRDNRTRDLGGPLTTQQFAEAVIQSISAR